MMLKSNRKQFIATGPVASQIAIKLLGTNGGGFFNVNAAHPFDRCLIASFPSGTEVTGGAWLSSARVVRCWVKSRNERNPYL